ncbi:hypothetical protein IWW50_000596 [Coemansia erecta]|nr:hypothetical protein IWW50_000596 [Coemansia erecta]
MQTLGYISVQPDWPIDVANARNGLEGEHKFWVSAYRADCPSIHASVLATKDSLIVDSDKLSATSAGARQLRLASPDLDIPPSLYTACAHTLVCSHITRGTGVRSFDVSKFGGLLVACGDDGVMDVYEAESGAHRVRLDGHLGDVTCCMLFPSGQVVLSGATDMRVKIWSASDGTNPVTLVGHTAPITDLAIIGVGKEVLSSAKDGSVRLWNCGSAACLHTFDLSTMPVNAIQYGDSTVAAACEDGRLFLIDVQAREVAAVFGSIGGPPMRAVAYDAQNNMLYGGQADGAVCVWDIDDPANPKHMFRRAQASISVLCLVRQESAVPSVCIGTEDGQLYLVSLSDGVQVIEDLVAFDVNPISQVRAIPAVGSATRQQIWASGQDSRVCRF